MITAFQKQIEKASVLYPDWTGPAVDIPGWAKTYQRCRPILMRIYASAPHWQQAEKDGIKHVSPILVAFCASPAEVKAQVGAGLWKQVHHAKLTSNKHRLTLMLRMGWSFEQSLIWPTRRRFDPWKYRSYGNAKLHQAARLAGDGGDVVEWLMLLRDCARMGVQIDPSWGRKRLRREHDAAALEAVLKNADPTPWAKSWFIDVDGYSFSLLTSEVALATEGATMSDCVRGYAPYCRSGVEVVLSIQGPERATCSWRRGDPALQVKGRFNRSVSLKCVRAAESARTAYEEVLRQQSERGRSK
ncbi:hypothetical protein [Roseovarius sp.]|uniref:hypothetical protein n=1 Tax=Roseovarius sp. TaxID=1486281 RepID=UPI003D0F3296